MWIIDYEHFKDKIGIRKVLLAEFIVEAGVISRERVFGAFNLYEGLNEASKGLKDLVLHIVLSRLWEAVEGRSVVEGYSYAFPFSF